MSLLKFLVLGDAKMHWKDMQCHSIYSDIDFLLLIADLLLKITEIRDTLLQESEIIANLLSGYSPKTNHTTNKNKTYNFIFWIGGLN